MSKRTPNLLIEDIIDSGLKILDYTKDLSFEDFLQDSKTVDAVIRNFEIIGEVANLLSEDFKDRYADEDFKDRYADIDWHRIRGFRNRIVHDYFGIDYSIVWQIKNIYLPEMIDKLRLIDV